MALALTSESEFQSATATSDGLVARVEVVPELVAGAAPWLELQSQDAVATPYQNYDFLKLWQQEVGQLRGHAEKRNHEARNTRSI